MEQQRQPPALLTSKEAAEVLRLHYRTVLDLLERGELDGFQTAAHGHWRVKTDAEGVPRFRRHSDRAAA